MNAGASLKIKGMALSEMHGSSLNYKKVYDSIYKKHFMKKGS